MPNVAIYNISGAKVGEMELSENIFGQELNVPAMHAYVKAYLANQRQGTQSVKTRAEVSGGGKKPWRQKGTGRARQGSTRSPQWTHGGVVFAPKPRDYRMSLNKKLKRLARRSALSYKMKDEAIKVVEDFAIEAPRTKTIVAMMNGLKVSDKKILVVLPESNRNILLSARNLQNVKVIPAANLNTYDVMNASSVLIAEGAVNVINEMLA